MIRMIMNDMKKAILGKRPNIMEDYEHWTRVFGRADFIKSQELIKQAEEDGWEW